MEAAEDSAYGTLWTFIQYWTFVLDEYGLPVGQCFISSLYNIYRSFSFVHGLVFLLKYVPTAFYMYKLIKSIHRTSCERIKQKKMELEDIELQIQIVNTKLCVRDAEFRERGEQCRRAGERLRALRARVRDMIVADEALRRAVDRATPWGEEPQECACHSTPEEEREFILTLLKELKADQVAIPEGQADKMDCGEHAHAHSDRNSTDNSVYSSLSDAETKDCQVKIVKVTNVYKVAYLRHYIKQKRLRRATKHALLKKKIESIRKLLEDWQKSLNMVLNTKLSMLDTSQFDMASQEAMGDYSKPNLRDSSDSDSDLRANGTDAYFDEYSLSWAQNPYRSYPYSYDDIPETTVAKEFYDSQDFNDIRYQPNSTQLCECNRPKANVLFILPEETSSQIAIEEIKSDHGSCGELEADSRDVIAL